MNTQCDVLIIGAGPAGALAAHKMAQAGMKVIVLEKAAEIKRKICGEYLCPLGLELLKNEGLADDVVGEFLRLEGMLIVTSRGTEVVAEFPAPERYQGVSVHRALFDANLIARAEKSGAQVSLGVDVKHVERSGEHWVVSSNRGQFMARVLIGADGRRSIVSKSLDNDLPNSGKRVAVHAFAFPQYENIRKGEMHIFEDGSYIGINPTGRREVNFSLVLDGETLQKCGGPMEALNVYLAQSKNLSSRFAKFEDEAQVKATFPIQHRTKSIIPDQGVALVGDAAGFVDPITGEGMYNALLSAQMLADEIIASRKNSIFVPPEVFTRYRQKYVKVLNQKTQLNRFFQILIRHPWFIERIAGFLLKRKSRADAFIGIIGNIYSPAYGIFKLL